MMRSERRNTVSSLLSRKAVLVLVMLLLCSLLLCGYSSEELKIFDGADLLTQEEEEDLQQLIVKAAEKTKQDIVIVTTKDTKGKSAKTYADDFFDEHRFGYEKESGSGILLLLAMDIREIYISTAGTGIEQYTNREIEWILDSVYEEMVDGDYYDACWSFLYDVKEYGVNDEVAMNGYYDPDQDVFVEYTPEQIREKERAAAMARIFSVGGILIRLLISAVIGAVAVLIMSLNVNSSKTPGGHVYIKAGGERILQRYDHRTHTTMTKRHIPRNNNTTRSGGGGGFSSSHRSSAGRSHGGGGRRF